jgi:hypothetical protein
VTSDLLTGECVKSGGGHGGRSEPKREQGSALLIVFVLAAAIAILLYREIPVVITEGQRQREQLLIDRGGQYQRAIQLYFRNRKSYPPSLDALESTNNMRFLRRRYVDPLTGKADWRLLHMGPAGPIDSLVNPINPAAGANATSGFGAQSSNASSQTSSDSASPQTGTGSGAASSGTAASGGDAAGGVPGMTQGQFGLQPDTSPFPARRAPAANAATIQRQAAAGGDPNDPNAPLSPDGSPMQAPGSGQSQSNDPTQAANQNQAPGQQANGGTGGTGGAGQNPNGGAANGDQNGSGTGTGTAAGMASQILHSPSPTITPGQSQSQSNPFGGGSIGGVASTVKGHSIKIVNDQRDYSKWEFVYDYRKDTGGNAAASAQNAGQTTTSAIGGGAVGGFSSPSAPAGNGTAPSNATAPSGSSGSQTSPNQ